NSTTTAPKIPMQISASLKVEERKVLARSTYTVPDSANGVDKRIGLLTVNLAADAADIDVDDVRRGIEMEIPYMLQQHRSRNNLAFIADQVLKELKFPWKKLDCPTRTTYRS